MSEVKEKLDELEKVLDEWVDFPYAADADDDLVAYDNLTDAWYMKISTVLLQLRIAIGNAGL